MRDRHQFDCHVRRLLQEFSFIRDLNEIVQSQIADIVHHEVRKEGDVLFRQDDEPTNAYIILAGEVQVWQKIERRPNSRPNSKHNDAPPLHEGNLAVRKHAEAILSILNEEKKNADMDEVERRKNKKRDKRRHDAPKEARCAQKRREDIVRAVQGNDSSEYSMVATLGSGMMFGEVGLLEDQPRNATIRCNTETEFLVINKTDFDRVLKAAMNRLRLRKLAGPMRAFLKEFDFFKKLDMEVQHQVPEILHYVHYHEGAVVFREGDKPQQIHIILTGQVTFWKKSADPENGPAPAPAAGKILKMKCAAMITRLRENEEYRHHQDWIETDENVDFSALGGQTALLGCGHTFGERALVEDSLQVATVTCSQDCEFLTINKSDFDTLLKQKMQEANMVLPSLIHPLIQKVPIFQKLGEGVQENLSYAMHYVKMERGHILYWEGTQPTNCYFLVEGTIGFWKRVPKEEELSDMGKSLEKVSGGLPLCENCEEVCRALNEIERPTHFMDLMKQAADMKKQKQLEAANDAKNLRLTMKMGIQVGLFGNGIVFGDQALMTDTAQTESVSCLETCKLLVLSKPDFDRVVKQEMLRVKVKQLASVVRRLLTEFDLFRDLASTVQENIAAIVHYMPMKAGQVVFEQGHNPNYCYIILSGEVTVWMSKTTESLRLARQAQRELHTMDADKTDADSPDSESDDDANKDPPLSPTFVRPPIVAASQQATEKCSALASMLGSFGGQGLSTKAFGHHAFMDTSTLIYNNDAVASLGPGTIFGELALLNDKPRNATISCAKDCAFLVMEKSDFDTLLKADMKRAKEKKLEFVRSVVPGARNLTPEIIDKMMYYFVKETVPRNHVFIEQGELLDGSIYFICEGSVESYLRDPATGGFVNRGILLQGSLFAAVPQGTRSTFTMVSKSSSCEVLHVKPESRKHLPECVLRSLRVILDQHIARRSAQSLPLAPLGSVFPAGKSAKEVAQQAKKQLPTSRSGKVPRPLSGKFPTIAARAGYDSPLRKKIGSMTCSLPAFAGLFQRERTEVDYEAFHLEPGETIAITAKRPRIRSKQKLHNRMSGSTSLPALV